jgi:hypothetical protein
MGLSKRRLVSGSLNRRQRQDRDQSRPIRPQGTFFGMARDPDFRGHGASS